MTEPLLRVIDLKTHFRIKASWMFGEKQLIKAIDGISFDIAPGEVLSLVGESGCGKSTVGRTLTHLEQATSGRALFEGRDFLVMSPNEFRPLRREIQMIFQDPFASLNPRLKIEQTLGEPLFIHGLCKTWDEARAKIAVMLETVGMDPLVMKRHPHEFSGGQRQRIGIARALAVKPDFLVCDEAIAALDVSIQSQILNLLIDLQQELKLSYLFIAHDLAVVKHISDRIAIMYLGKIVETGAGENIYHNPNHPYTQSLISAIPVPDPHHQSQRIILSGDVPSPIDPPSGCSFHTRCPRATDLCREQAPVLKVHGAGAAQTTAACHHI